jgi:hypothetical protein
VKGLKAFSLYLALAIVLLHSIVPHHHHNGALAEESCVDVDQGVEPNWWDLLSDPFHPDLGEDHFEDWRGGGSQFSLQLDFTVLSTPLMVCPDRVDELSANIFYYQLYFHERPYLQKVLERGPPQVMRA